MAIQLAVTMGDPAGVGPELCLQLFLEKDLLCLARPIVFGDAMLLDRVARHLGLPFPWEVIEYEAWAQHAPVGDQPLCVHFPEFELTNVTPGRVNTLTGGASFRYVDAAISAAMSGQVDGIVTGPIHKEAWQQAHVPYPGHTELLAERTFSDRSCMMLTSDEITCSFVTSHCGLREVPGLVTPERVLEVIELTDATMRRRLGREPRLVVCGLNPHAGEHGLFGEREEERLIEPAVREAAEKGIMLRGPLPADTAFVPQLRESTDAYICMYHDQGLAVLKALAFDHAVNVTLGLPIVRTSVDHGTALDIAWQGVAERSSFREAYRLAAKLVLQPDAPPKPDATPRPEVTR